MQLLMTAVMCCGVGSERTRSHTVPSWAPASPHARLCITSLLWLAAARRDRGQCGCARGPRVDHAPISEEISGSPPIEVQAHQVTHDVAAAEEHGCTVAGDTILR